MDIDVDIVKPLHQNARFFKADTTDMVEISFVGSKDTLVKKVKPEHMARFRDEWNAYCDGRPIEQRKGTSLATIPGLDETKVAQFIHQNVHTAEELAALSDIQCQALGHGTRTARANAQQLLRARADTAAANALDKISKAAEKIGTTPAGPSPEVAELKAEVAGLKEGMNAILAALADLKPKKAGRPKKEPAQ